MPILHLLPSDATTVDERDKVPGQVDSLASSVCKHAKAALESRASTIAGSKAIGNTEKAPTIPELLALVDNAQTAGALDAICVRAKRFLGGTALKSISNALDAKSAALADASAV